MNNNCMDLVGHVYGKFTVIEKTNLWDANGKRQWNCRCECGTIKLVAGNALRSGNTTSCGCGKGKKPRDLTGKRFNMLTVVRAATQEEASALAGDRPKWFCQCDCGGTKICESSYLGAYRGENISCGCTRRAAARRNGALTVDAPKSIAYRRRVTIDLTGATNGLLSYIGEAGFKRYENLRASNRRIRVMCACGSPEKEMNAHAFISGRIKSCGCLRDIASAGKKGIQYPTKIDYTDQTIGRWKVIKRAENRIEGTRQHSVAYWQCVCSCGTQRDVSQHSLARRTSTSCGCYHRENASVTALSNNQKRWSKS